MKKPKREYIHITNKLQTVLKTDLKNENKSGVNFSVRLKKDEISMVKQPKTSSNTIDDKIYFSDEIENL